MSIIKVAVLRKLSVRLFAFLLTVMLAACMNIPSSIVKEEEWFKNLPQTHAADMYKDNVQSGEALYFLPIISAKPDSINKLVLIDVQKDPIYESFEIQVVESPDSGNRTFGVAIAVRKDGTKDYYYQKGLELSQEKRNSLNSLLNAPRIIERDFEYYLNVDAAGLDAKLNLIDTDGKNIVLRIREHQTGRRLSGILAPVSVQAINPTSFPLVYLDEYGMVAKQNTQIEITIDGQARKAAVFPILIEGNLSYYGRYSSKVAIADILPEGDTAVPAVFLLQNQDAMQVESAGGMDYQLDWTNGFPEITSASIKSSSSDIQLHFRPALPNLACLKTTANLDGRFVIRVNKIGAVIAGSYTLKYDQVTSSWFFTLQPQKGWQPPGMSKKPWVSTFRYEAFIQLQADAEKPLARIQSDWFRTSTQ